MATAHSIASETSQLIGGEWDKAGGATFDVVNPANEETIATLASSTAEDVDRALASARSAQKAWRATPIVERGDRIRAMAALVEENRDTLAALLVREVGKPMAQAAGEVDFAAGFLRYNADWDRRLEGEVLPGDVAGEVIHLLRAPLGVVAAICPWNYPLAVLCRKLGPALVTGNAVVAKPSEIAPLAAMEAVRLFDEAGLLPPGVLNLVSGAGSTGEALVTSPLTSMVSFTGHRDTGKRVMALASERLTRVALELGGKAPAIVWHDADLEVAVPAVVAARHTNCGQVCTAAERVFVHREILDEFSDRYVRAVRNLVVGDPAGDVDVGPLVSAAQHAKTTTALERAIDEGASVVTGGSRPEGDAFARGYWFAPTVLADVRPDMDVMREEVFGPVTPIVGVSSLEEALELANDSRYGLSAYLFTNEYGTVMRTVNDLEFGEIYVNRTLGESIHAHHAGFKESGIGGEDGKWGLLRYTQLKTAYHHYGR
jgi:lactaldehyde dehydrogenase/glycolaldehyde dehydrogenase